MKGVTLNKLDQSVLTNTNTCSNALKTVAAGMIATNPCWTELISIVIPSNRAPHRHSCTTGRIPLVELYSDCTGTGGLLQSVCRPRKCFPLAGAPSRGWQALIGWAQRHITLLAKTGQPRKEDGTLEKAENATCCTNHEIYQRNIFSIRALSKKDIPPKMKCY